MLLARRCAGHALLLLALLIFPLSGCRSPEPAPEQNTAAQGPAPVAPEPAPPAPPSPLPEPAADSQQTAPPAAEPEKISALPTAPRPLVAIIIDDMGHNRPLDLQFLQLDANLSFAFLPQAPFTAELAEQAYQGGHDVLVHLPMEPKDPQWRLETDTLLVRDSPERIRRKTEAMLAAMPRAMGASNHMGSRFSEDGKGMRLVLETLQARSLFFVDSFTSGASQGLATARRLGLPSTRRHLFLDNVREAAVICGQIDQLGQPGAPAGRGRRHRSPERGPARRPQPMRTQCVAVD